MFAIILRYFFLFFISVSLYGGNSLSFLNIGVGAESLSIGNNGVVKNTGESVYWNPAAMILLKSDVIYLEHKEWIADTSFNFLSYIHNNEKKNNSFGLAVMTLTMPDMPLTYDSSTSVGSFSSYSAALFFSYGRDIPLLLNNLKIGITLKLLKEEVYTRTLVCFAGDISFFYETLKKDLKVGLNIKNLGPAAKFNGQAVADNLPTNILSGISYSLLNKSFIINLGGRYFIYNNIFNYNFGIQYIIKLWHIKGKFSMGYQSSNISYSILDNLTFGTGVIYKNYTISYASFLFHSLQFIHDISLSVKF